MPTMSDLRAEAKELGINAPFGTTKEDLMKKIEEKQEELTAPRIETKELINPATTAAAIMDSTVHNTLTDEQRRAKLEAEIKAQIEREEIEKRLRREAQLAERRVQQMDKYRLKYDLADMREKATAIARAKGCDFVIDAHPDGSLVGTYHIYGRGKVFCGNLAQPLDKILQDVRISANTAVEADMRRREDMVYSQFDGRPIATTVQVVGEQLAGSNVADIADSSPIVV